jgi:hypothetical protein
LIGDKSLPGNNRPISVLPNLSKIFEKHVATHLYLYLSKYKLLHESQSGFFQMLNFQAVDHL